MLPVPVHVPVAASYTSALPNNLILPSYPPATHPSLDCTNVTASDGRSATTSRNRCGPDPECAAFNSQCTASARRAPFASISHGVSIFTPCPALLLKCTSPFTNSTRVPSLSSLN